MEKILLNSHASTPPCSLALEWMKPYLETNSAIADDLFEQRRQMIYDLVGAEKEDQLVITSSGAEAINQVLWSVFLEVVRKEGKTHLITSCLEDAPTLQMMKRCEELGCFVKIAPANERGEIDLEELRKLISPRTALISIGMAQGLTGVIQPVEEIAQIAKEKNVLLHLDGSYAVGKTYIAGLAGDYLTFSGDLIHSVKGTGALFAKKGRPLVPLILGERAREAGFMALCAAAHQANLSLDAMSLEVARLRDQFEQELQRRIPGARVAFERSLRLPNTTTILFPRVHQEALDYYLSQKELSASIGGDYCQHLHSLLVASKVNAEEAQTAMSFSLSRMTHEAEVTNACDRIVEVVESLQKISEDLF